MPDIKTMSEIMSSQSVISSTMSESISERTVLESLLDKISLECVLADISDPESFSELLPLLKTFFQKSKDCNFPELAEDAKKAGKIVKLIMEHQHASDKAESGESKQEITDRTSDVESNIDSLNLIISEMKSFLHFITQSSEKQEYQRSYNQIGTDSLSDTTGALDGAKSENRPEIQPETQSKVKVEAETKDQNLIHPGQLPGFLNLDDFAEFLLLQKNTLEKMEVLILDIEKNNNRAYAQGELKRLFHTTKGEAGFLGLKDVEKVCHKAEDLMDTQNFGNIVDILLAVKDWLEVTYNIYAGNPGVAPSTEKIIELFNEDHIKASTDFNATHIVKESPSKNIFQSDGKSISYDNNIELKDKKFAQPDGRSSQSEHEEPPSTISHSSPILTESINVDAARLDRMVNIIGELAIAESIVTQSPEITATASPTLSRALNSLHKITKELQTLGLSLRMVPLKSLFNRMDRVTRDLAKKTGKKIQFIVRGESTELDKTLVDKLGDPLIHLVRNSVDHGVEDDINKRIKAGKPEIATIELRAFHKGGYLFIEVEDDGRGVDRQRLLEKATSLGLIKSTNSQGIVTSENIKQGDKVLGDDILNLVFHPGLTTASKITDVSGRGVGMDVVRKSIESCRGKVSIASTEGKGTTCTIKIPLTLSIIDGLVVRVINEKYVIPTLSVVTSLKVDSSQISNVFEKGEMINVLGRLIPLFRLNRLFKLKDSAMETFNGIVVVVEDNGTHTALLVDELIGKQNTVIKNLGMGIGMGMENIKGISGGTIMPDGKVSLILDIAAIIELSHARYE